MTDTEKQRLTLEGWRNLTYCVRDGTWHGLFRGQGGWWLCHDLLGERRDDWHDDERVDQALAELAEIEAVRIVGEMSE